MAGRPEQNPLGVAKRRNRLRTRGTTLIEVMLAGALLLLMVLSLFEGIAVAARIARENAEYLQADAYAFDLAWKRHNESYQALRNFATGTVQTETITEEAAPMLYRNGSAAVSHTRITRVYDPNNTSVELGILISVDVEWGKAGSRRRRSGSGGESDYGKWITVFKGGSEDG